MKFLSRFLLILLSISCSVPFFRSRNSEELIVEKGYKFPTYKYKEGEKAYVHMYKRKAKKGDLSLLCKWKPIQSLEFEDITFESGYFSEAAECKDLERISFNNCNPVDVDHFRSFPSLHSVSIGGSHYSDETLIHLSQIKNLKLLFIGFTPVTSHGVKYLAENAKGIENLDIEDTDTIDDTVFQYLLEMPKLREVSLRRTKVTREAAHDFRIAYKRRYGRQIYLYTQQRSDSIE